MSEDRKNSGAADELRSFVERIEKLSEEKATIASDIKDVFAEAKGRGFDAPAMREVIRRRKMDHAQRQEREAIVEQYSLALGL